MLALGKRMLMIPALYLSLHLSRLSSLGSRLSALGFLFLCLCLAFSPCLSRVRQDDGHDDRRAAAATTAVAAATAAASCLASLPPSVSPLCLSACISASAWQCSHSLSSCDDGMGGLCHCDAETLALSLCRCHSDCLGHPVAAVLCYDRGGRAL